MGYYHTYHLFDDKKFYCEIVPRLKGQTGSLDEPYEIYKKRVFPDHHRFIIEDVITIANRFNDDFLSIPGVEPEWQVADKQCPGIEDFIWFFEGLVFTECALLRPCFVTGKSYIDSTFDFQPGSMAQSMIKTLTASPVLCIYGNGVCGWINAMNVKSLLTDYVNVHKDKRRDDSTPPEDFRQFLEIAARYDLGILMAIEARDSYSDNPPPISIPASEWEPLQSSYDMWHK